LEEEIKMYKASTDPEFCMKIDYLVASKQNEQKSRPQTSNP
jgi:transposase-like protein